MVDCQNKKTSNEILSFWYEEWDSNPQGRFGQEILSLSCIPFHHPRILLMYFALRFHKPSFSCLRKRKEE